eukprot:2251325-Amphidinium_carterae.1
MVGDIEELDLRDGRVVMARVLAMDKVSTPHRVRVRLMDTGEELVALLVDSRPEPDAKQTKSPASQLGDEAGQKAERVVRRGFWPGVSALRAW